MIRKFLTIIPHFRLSGLFFNQNCALYQCPNVLLIQQVYALQKHATYATFMF